LAEVGRQYNFDLGERDGGRVAWAQARIRHIATTDPGGSVVAEHDGAVVGIGLSLRRGSFWFLSLLAVRSGLQDSGIGRRLLDATLDYGKDCTSAMICASPDPKALRRYGRAGFDLHPGFEAVGVPDRAELPAGLGVRDGDWDRDTDLIEQLLTERRGEPYGPDLAWCREQGIRLLVRDGAARDDRAVALCRPGHVGHLVAASDAAATRVLWAALAETQGTATVGYLLGNQQWAITVAQAARLSLRSNAVVCTRGMLAPPTPYLPSGVFG
jgi:GNAT superfamily N-acetyltransferase